MLIYKVAIAVFLIFAAWLLVSVNWYTALVSVGIALSLYFMMQSKEADDAKGRG